MTEQAGTPEKRRAEPWEAAFLEALARKGVVSYACKAVKVGRTTVYHYRNSCPDFRAAWDAAMENAADAMEQEAWRRAVRGCKRPVFGSGGPGVGTVEVGQVREYSDTLLIFLLKAARPGKFREVKLPELEAVLARLPVQLADGLRQALGEHLPRQ